MEAIMYAEAVKALTIKGIPDGVLQRFKAWCALHGLTLADAIIRLMKEKGDDVELRSADK